MKQSLLASWFETVANTATGFLISLGLQYIVCWWYDLPLRLHDNLGIIALFTVASLLRSIGWRRLMERLHIRIPLSPFMQAVAAERRRQIEIEGWSHAHDDSHERGDLAEAGACYAQCAGTNATENAKPPVSWPWDIEWWKPTGFRRDLVKAAALIVAEGERFDRLKGRKPKAALLVERARI